MSQQLKEVVSRFFEAWNTGDIGEASSLIHGDYEWSFPGVLPTRALGPIAFGDEAITYRSAFPDLNFVIEDLIAEANHVVAVFSVSGTQQREFAGIAPTGRQVEAAGVAVIDFTDDLIRAIRSYWSHGDLGQQLRTITS